MRFGPWFFFPRAEVDESYNSNINAGSGAPPMYDNGIAALGAVGQQADAPAGACVAQLTPSVKGGVLA